MEKSLKKRLIIISIYLSIFSLVIWGIYALMSPEETCFDKIKNQNEEGIDCGGTCANCKTITAKPLEILEYGFVESGISGKYDFWAVVLNTNNTYGAKFFSYRAAIKSADGKILFERSGGSFVLPGERKYVIENNLPAEISPDSTEFNIGETEWMSFNEYYERPQLKVVNKTYNEISSDAGFSEAKGLLKNESPFDFQIIKILIILKNSSGKIIATNSTEIRAVKSGEERDFKVFWPNHFQGEVRDIEVQPEVNIFDSDSFLKRFYNPQQF